MAVGANVTPHFVKAKTSEMLVKKMRKLQAIQGRYLAFHDIQYADGFWYAWYENEVNKRFIEDPKVKEV